MEKKIKKIMSVFALIFTVVPFSEAINSHPPPNQLNSAVNQDPVDSRIERKGILKKSLNDSIIQGHYPTMQSIGAELLTPNLDDESPYVIKSVYPFTYSDNSEIKVPTIGSIIYVPDIFCLLEQTPNSKDTNTKYYQHFFSLKDKDLDPCDSDLATSDQQVEWYLLDDVKPWHDKLSWSDLNPQRIDESFVIKASDSVHKSYYQKEAEFAENGKKKVNLNVFDAVRVPPQALGKRIGFRLVPKTRYGNPTNGKPLFVWDLNHLFAQVDPSKAGVIEEDNPGFIIGDKPILENNPSTAGGAIQLGHSPYVRSIGAQLTSEGAFDAMNTGISWLNWSEMILNNKTYSLLNENAILYIPDLFCEYKNTHWDKSDPNDYFPTQSEKLKYYRPLFWIADADEDMCQVTSEQIQWVITEPSSEKWVKFKDKINGLGMAPMNKAVHEEMIAEAHSIWQEVKNWDDVQIVESNLSHYLIETEPLQHTRFDGMAKFTSAIKVPPLSKKYYGTSIGFIFTPKTSAGMPDTGRAIKVPNAINTLWGQTPIARANSLEEADNISKSSQGELIGYYPQLRMMTVDNKEEVLSFKENQPYFNQIDLACLLDETKIPVESCQNLSKGYGFMAFGAIALPKVANLRLEGFIGEGETLDVFYDFIPSMGSNKRNEQNKSTYAFSRQGKAEIEVMNSNNLAGQSPTVGINQFKIGPLTKAEASQVMEVALLAKDGFYQTGGIFKVSTENLPFSTSPEINNLQIQASSSPITLGTRLDGAYDFIPAKSSQPSKDASEYTWFLNQQTIGKPDQEVTVSGTVGSLIIEEGQMGRVIGLKVRAKDELGRIGNELYKEIDIPSPPPTIANLSIDFKNSNGLDLIGRYDYKASPYSPDPDDASEYRWFVDGQVVTQGIVKNSGLLSDETGFKVDQSLVGRSIQFGLLAKDKHGSSASTEIKSPSVVYEAPSIENISLLGNPIDREYLSVDYKFVGKTNNIDKTLVEWSYSDKSIQLQASEQYLLTASQVGYRVQARIIPVDGNGIRGESKFVGESGLVKRVPPEIQRLFIGYPPHAYIVPGDVLSGHVIFVPGTDESNISRYSWLLDNEPHRFGQVNSAGEIPSFIVDHTHIGHMIGLRFEPINKSGDRGKIHEVKAKSLVYQYSTISDLRINMTDPKVGSILKATYKFHTGMPSDIVDRTRYRWYKCSAAMKPLECNSVLLGTIEVSGYIPDYEIKQSDKGFYLKLEVSSADNSWVGSKNTESLTTQYIVE